MVLHAFWLLLLGTLAGLAHGSENGRLIQIQQTLKELAKNATLEAAFAARAEELKITGVKASSEFPCPSLPRSATRPTSVHQLRPGDIDVIAAMGDSLTAGTGITACTILGLLTADRGLAWSIGGDESYEEQPTLPNILKKYNPNLKGFSRGSGDVDDKSSGLNVAVPGYESVEIVEEARMLVDKMRADPNIDFQNDWKLITVLIGDNDLCAYCKDKEKYSSANYIQRVQTALDILHAEVPRAFVSIVEILNIDIVNKLNKGLICTVLHLVLCSCASHPKNDDAYEELKEKTKEYQSLVSQLAMSGRYDTKEDFTVIDQPFFRDTYLPYKNDKPDLSFFAPDCFHLSRKGQAAAAEGIWNNMIEAAQVKKTVWSPGEAIECPTEANPYFFTYKNSQNRTSTIKQQGEKKIIVKSLNVESLNREQLEQNSDSATPSFTGGFIVLAVCLVSGVVALLAVLAVVLKRRQSNQLQNKSSEVLPHNHLQSKTSEVLTYGSQENPGFSI